MRYIGCAVCLLSMTDHHPKQQLQTEKLEKICLLKQKCYVNFKIFLNK